MDPRLLGQEPEFVQEEEQDDVSKLQGIIRELDLSGGVARIFRQTAGRAEFDYEGEVPVDGFNLETVKRVYGGGRYIIRFAAKGGRYVRSIKFSVSPHHRGELDMAATPSASGPDNGMIALLMQQAQQSAQQQQQMMTLMVTMMSESNKSMAQVIAAAIGGNRHSQEPRMTVDTGSKTMELLMPLMIEGLKPRGGTAEVVEQLKLLKELTGEPEKEKDEDMLTKIMNVGGPILGALMNRGTQAPIPMPAPSAPQPAANPALPPTPNPAEEAARRKAEELLMKLRFATPMLVKGASEGKEIQPYLDTLNDMVDDEGYEMLCHLLEQPNWIEILFGNNPGVEANRQWFENFREVILNPEDETTGSQTPETPVAPSSPLHPA